MQKKGIKINGYIGTWCVIAENYYRRKKVYLLEHERFGAGAACLIVDDKMNLIMDDVFCGFSELD